jgi:5-methylcytosine-specific restriction endonuclease McrA
VKDNKAFYHSAAWKNTRRNYKQSVGGLCERCLAKGMIVPADIVHHKIPLTDENVNDLSISLSWDNLQALCRQCHAEVHDDMYAERTGRRYKINNNGQVVIRDNAE